MTSFKNPDGRAPKGLEQRRT
uniref:Uncharacterized protein n=1 Tax=Anguilla anguilla TaxID=7936 RepID=A0A0E9SY01_ANGAN